MIDKLKNSLSRSELLTLSSIVHVGNAAYSDLMENQRPLFGHPYFADIKGRVRTKLVQMQCEIESHDPNFPFSFAQIKFSYRHIIPQLRSKNMILHIARSSSPQTLSYASKYKVDLSYNNDPLFRQERFFFEEKPIIREDPFYGILTFGGVDESFTVIQFPEPGYTGIIDHIDIPTITMVTEPESSETFERKKARLKKEFLAHEAEASNL